MRFDNAFTPTGLCSPVRCSLLSGVYPHEHRVLTNVGLHPVREQLEPDDDLLGQALKQAGYAMGCVGKWHVSKKEPPEFGYDDYVGLSDYPPWRRQQGHDMPEAFSNYRVQVGVRDDIPPGKSRPAFLVDNAIRLLETYARSDNPFFLRVDFHGPHFPNVVPDPYFSMYDPATNSRLAQPCRYAGRQTGGAAHQAEALGKRRTWPGRNGPGWLPSISVKSP